MGIKSFPPPSRRSIDDRTVRETQRNLTVAYIQHHNENIHISSSGGYQGEMGEEERGDAKNLAANFKHIL